MNIAEIVKHRYTTKVFDAGKKIPEAQFQQLKDVLRYSPSSVNNQPWHFIIAKTDEAKMCIADGATPSGSRYQFNRDKLLACSHLIVLCSKTEMDDEYLTRVADQEASDGRYASDEARQAVETGRLYFTDLHRYQHKDVKHWMEKQVYLAMGTLLLSAATMGIDAVPVEGFDPASLDVALELHKKGLTSVTLVGLGYRSEDDFNASLPKSRFPEAVVFTEL